MQQHFREHVLFLHAFYPPQWARDTDCAWNCTHTSAARVAEHTLGDGGHVCPLGPPKKGQWVHRAYINPQLFSLIAGLIQILSTFTTNSKHFNYKVNHTCMFFTTWSTYVSYDVVCCQKKSSGTTKRSVFLSRRLPTCTVNLSYKWVWKSKSNERCPWLDT